MFIARWVDDLAVWGVLRNQRQERSAFSIRDRIVVANHSVQLPSDGNQFQAIPFADFRRTFYLL